QASTELPVIITHTSGHLSACNSTALRLAKVDRDTKDPAGGRFDRDADGEPTGLLEESAAAMVRAALPSSAEKPTETETVAADRNGLRESPRHGVTGTHVAGTDLTSARLLTQARDLVPIRLYIMLRESQLDEAVRRKNDKAHDEAGVRYGAIKVF